MKATTPVNIEERIAALKVLIVDDDPFMRRVVRAMLGAVGVKRISDASDGLTGLEAIRTLAPDIVILDWEMPTLDGAGFVRTVRAPGTFPFPDVPIIMLSGHGDRWRVVEAARVGVNEYLLKPVSTKALRDRIVSVLTKPRPMMRVGDKYLPAPRSTAVLPPEPPRPAAAPAKLPPQPPAKPEVGRDIVMIG